MFRVTSQQDAILQALNYVVSKSGIGNMGAGSKARALIEAVAAVVGNVGDEVAFGLTQNLLPNATGAVLDLLASSYGLDRLPPEPARIDDTDGNLKYYVKNQTFGGINNGNSIIVPAGTIIKSSETDSNFYFIQRNSVVLDASASFQYFSADQAGAVNFTPVSPNVLNKHNFTGYTQAAFNTLLVTNEKGTAGRPVESDANLRFRIRSYISSRSGANAIAIRLAALQAPGVSDVKVIPNRAGVGTFDVVVFGTSPIVSQSVLDTVYQNVINACAMGTQPIVVPARLVGVSLNTTIKFAIDTTASEKNSAIITARNAIRQYITDLNPGNALSINILSDIVRRASTKVEDLGTPGKPFNSIYIWKEFNDGSRRFSRKLERDYIIGNDEEIVVEPYINNPIELVEG